MTDTAQIATADDRDRDQDRRRSRRLADALRLRTRFLSLADLDGRTGTTRRVRDLIRQFETDIPDPTTAQRQIITRCALTSVMIEDIEARYLKGHAIDPLIHNTLSNGLRRLLTTLGLERRMRDTQTLDQYLASTEHGNGQAATRQEVVTVPARSAALEDWSEDNPAAEDEDTSDVENAA